MVTSLGYWLSKQGAWTAGALCPGGLQHAVIVRGRVFGAIVTAFGRLYVRWLLIVVRVRSDEAYQY